MNDFNKLKDMSARHIDPAEKIKYLMAGEEGLYVFADHWKDVYSQVKLMQSAGFELIAVDGIDGCNLGGIQC